MQDQKLKRTKIEDATIVSYFQYLSEHDRRMLEVMVESFSPRDLWSDARKAEDEAKMILQEHTYLPFEWTTDGLTTLPIVWELVLR